MILAGGLLLGQVIALGELVPALMIGPAGLLFKALRVVLGLPFVLFVPGYLLQAAFFPQRRDLDNIERAGLSLGLSVALVIFLVLLVDALPWGLRPIPIILAQVVLVLLLMLAATVTRWLQPASMAYSPAVRPQPRRWWAGMGLVERLAMLGMAAAVLMAALIATWIFLGPKPAEQMTEFYILGQEGLAEDYPRQALPGETIQLLAGIINHESVAKTYTVDVWVQDGWNMTRRQQVASYGSYPIAPGDSTLVPLAWQMPWEGQDQMVEIILFVQGESSPYRSLRLWLDVVASP